MRAPKLRDVTNTNLNSEFYPTNYADDGFRNKLFSKLSRSPFFDCKKCAPLMGPTPPHLATPHKPHNTQGPKVTLNRKLMFFGHLQVLFYARPPNSQLLFSKPGKAPLLEDFDQPTGPPGCVKSKSSIKPKVTVSGSPTSFVLYNTPKFPTCI